MNLLTIVVLAVAIIVILILRKRGEQQAAGGSTPSFSVSVGTAATSGGDFDVHDPGIHAQMKTAVHVSTNLVSRMQGEERVVLDRWLGSGGSAWTDEQQAKFSAGFERFLWDGEGLPGILSGVSKMLHLKYPTVAGTPLDIELPQDVRAVFANLTGGSLSTSSTA